MSQAVQPAGYPETLFHRLRSYDIGLPGQNILDLGTGTGYLAALWPDKKQE
ncbi:hypothetical protein [Thermoactinomyces mirandus]|uniref:hypothetical protein n=1 Tax=Thermoactinomyces mirandus TaxID=2756294 RepID=UPI0015EF001B|nr:hypothetical protein [Thermoactinomyces mirandus]